MASPLLIANRRRALGLGLCLTGVWWCLAPVVAFAQAVASPASSPFNVHLVVTEDLLNCFVSRREVEPGPVRETINDVEVHGQRLSVVDLRLDLLPSADRAYAQLVLNGNVQTRTTGFSQKATVHSVGWQRFRAVKDVLFDGTVLSTRHATIDVQTNNQPVEFHTPYDGTLAEGVAKFVAAHMAEQRKPQTEELSRQRVIERVQPQFDSRIDNTLAQANDALETNVRSVLRQRELLPLVQRVTTTDRHLHYAAAIGIRAEATVAPPRASLLSAHGVNLYVHESAFNGLLDRLKLKGLRTTDRELRSLSTRLRSLGGHEPDAEQEPSRGLSLNLDTEIEFDAERPLWVELGEEQLMLRLRVALRPAGQNLMPPVDVAIPFRLEERGDHWQLTTGAIDIRSQRDGTPLPDIAAAMIREAVEASLVKAAFPRELPIPNWPQRKPRLKLSAVRAADGWLAISLD